MDRETALRLLEDDQCYVNRGKFPASRFDVPEWKDGRVIINGAFTADQLRALIWFHDEEGAQLLDWTPDASLVGKRVALVPVDD